MLAGMMQAAAADDPPVPPRDRLWYTNSTFLRVNPLGLVDVYRLGWRRRVTEKTGLLWNDTYTFLAGSALVTPAFSRLGVYAEAQPISLLRVWADGGFTGYYGTIDQVLSWSDPYARYDDRTLSERGEAGENAPTLGSYLTLGAAVRAKVGPIAIRDTVQVTRLDLDLPEGDDRFYDQLADRLVPDEGFVLGNDLDLMGVGAELRVGARYTFTDDFSRREVLQSRISVDGVPDGAMAHHRVGPLVAWQLADHGPGARFDQPTLFLLVQWWLAHPYRTGEAQPAGLPLVAVGFSFNGDLLGDRAAPH